ncbi:MAG: cold shock domain-containing protein [Chloroflexi bacterium]|nr:cold shock domain-containing protein [Chloroflexota bacterium]
MNFRDRRAKDEDGREFIFTVEMQRRLSQAGLPLEPDYLSQLGDYSEPPDRVERAERAERPERQSVSAAPPARDGGPASAAGPGDMDVDFTIQIDPQTGKYIGRLKWYNPQKGYGFLVRGAGEEIFFHKSSTVGRPEDLNEGQWVLYDIEETRKGPEAMEIEPYLGEIE